VNVTYERARQFFRDRNQDFERTLEFYLRYGYAFLTPQYIMLAEERQDSWHIEFAIGEVGILTFLRHMPYHKPWISWSRDGGRTVKRFATDRLIKLTTKL